MTTIRKIAIISIASLTFFAASACVDPQPKPPSGTNSWLASAESDAIRFELLERYLRGFDQPMWEVGERYGVIHQALTQNNFELAEYHWNKIKTTVENGYLKRPARRANADALFLDGIWPEVLEAFTSKDIAAAWTGFRKAREACIECHIAESVAYMNNQPLFDLTAPAPDP